MGSCNRKTLGYGFRLSSESTHHAIKEYYSGGLLKSYKAVTDEIANAKRDKLIGKSAKPRVFKVIIIEEEN